LQFLQPGVRMKVDGLVPNHSEVAGTSIDDPYFHIVLDGGRSGFISAVILSNATTEVNPVAAAAECKKKGAPKLGVSRPSKGNVPGTAGLCECEGAEDG
jgi:hypothetical protein